MPYQHVLLACLKVILDMFCQSAQLRDAIRCRAARMKVDDSPSVSSDIELEVRDFASLKYAHDILESEQGKGRIYTVF